MIAFVLFVMTDIMMQSNRAEAKKRTFTVSSKTIPCSSSYRQKPYYNKKTKQYYMINSYMRRLSTTGGTPSTLSWKQKERIHSLWHPKREMVLIRTSWTTRLVILVWSSHSQSVQKDSSKSPKKQQKLVSSICRSLLSFTNKNLKFSVYRKFLKKGTISTDGLLFT